MEGLKTGVDTINTRVICMLVGGSVELVRGLLDPSRLRRSSERPACDFNRFTNANKG